jgi:predicted PurR-regulated permease PerM
MSTESNPKPVSIRIPFVTILLVLATILAARCLEVLYPLFLSLIIGIMVAVSLAPLLNWMVRLKIPRHWGVSLIAILLAATLAAIMAFMLPEIFTQASNFIKHLPQLRIDILEQLGESNALYPIVDKGLRREFLFPKFTDFSKVMGAGHLVLGGFAEILLVMVLTVYLLQDGPRMIEWLSAFFSESTQQKLRATNAEMAKIVSAYIKGQVITSVLSFAYVFIALSVLHVPNVMLLATLSGVMDVLPVLGFFLAVIPAMFFALQVSSGTALIALLLYIIYHAIENYLIVPLVYGNRMRVSSFAVFFGLLVAGLLAGIPGAIAVLPIIASYPVIEKIWLARVVGEKTLRVHEK